MHPEAILGTALLLGAWTWAWVRQGQRPDAGRTLALALGLLAGLVATVGPVHDLAERVLFSAHMVQHLLLMLVAPPLLLAATPSWMIDSVLAPLHRRPLLAGAARQLTRPVPALGLYAAALAVWHLPGPFDRAVASPAWHAAEHAVLVATAFLAWWPVLSPSRLLPPLHYGAQILYLFAFGLPMTAVAAMITGADEVLYPFYAEAARGAGIDALADQRLGGILMWVPAGIVPLAAFTVAFFRWAADEADDIPGTSLAATPPRNRPPRRRERGGRQ
jgi:putative membrane protein